MALLGFGLRKNLDAINITQIKLADYWGRGLGQHAGTIDRPSANMAE
jgi:hypothetical protein